MIMQKVIDWFKKRALRGQFYAVAGFGVVGVLAKQLTWEWFVALVVVYFAAYFIQDVLDERKRNACEANCGCDCMV